ncbi:DNA cytosine methyltransferase [Thiolapillus sp.]
MSIKSKIDRFRNGGKHRVLDLFAGCGGISTGFHAEGFKIAGAVELDPKAVKTHAKNFHSEAPNPLFAEFSKARDITVTEADILLKDIGLEGPTESHIDILVGGPPCQAFARVGRAKLREVAEHPAAFLQDSRSNLYLRYLDYIRELKPYVVLVENVPDVLNYGGHNIAREICEVLDDLGYEARYTMLNAVYYGVPEMRERMFLLAYHRLLDVEPVFPEPTHWIDLPRGYHGSRQVALKYIKGTDIEHDGYYVDPPEPHIGLQPAITAQEALSDLPVIPDDSEQKKKKGPRPFNRCDPYRTPPTNEYQNLMRNWPAFPADDFVSDHVIRYLPRDYKIFARMAPGDQYPEAHALALRMFEDRLDDIEASEGKRPPPNSARYKKEYADFVPPYDPGKFPNKWRKMEPDKPARTLMAHLGKDSYSHIHYDSIQARTISVREAARLQSFPDGFVFEGPMNPAFRQIGNAVPPLMARALARQINMQLQGDEHDAADHCPQAAVSV